MKRGNFKFYANFAGYIPGIADGFILLLMLVIGALIGNIISLAVIKLIPGSSAMQYATMISYPVMFIPAMIYASLKSHAAVLKDGAVIALDRDNFAPIGGALAAVLAIVLTFSTGYIADAVNTLLPEMPKRLKDLMEMMTSGNFVINFLCVSIMAPFFEEWLCRGMILRGLLGKGMSPALAIVISAAVFGLIHLNPWQAVPAFLLGCGFGYVYYKTGSLKLTMLMHFTNNTFALVTSRIPAFKDAETWKNLLGDTPFLIILAASVILTILTLLQFKKVKD